MNLGSLYLKMIMNEEELLEKFKSIFPIMYRGIVWVIKTGDNCLDMQFQSGLKIRFSYFVNNYSFDVLK
jgi:hypothetical protein